MRWLLVLAVFLSACCSSKAYKHRCDRLNAEWVQKIDSTAFSEVIIPYAMELARTSRLRYEDGKVYYNDNVQRVRLIFSTQNILELCEARELMVDVVEGFLTRLNGDPSIGVNFDHYPITAEDLEIYFSYESYYIEYIDPTYLAWMSLHDGTARYYTGLLKDFRKDFWFARVEPYAKTLEYVRIQRQAEEQYMMQHPPRAKEGFFKIIN